MNYIRHLNAFFSFVRNDKRLACSHVSLYLALFQYWNYNRFQNPFPVYRDNLMQLSKIGSKNTYHKCIKELHAAGYIMYNPPTSKFQPVKISLIRLDIKEEQRTAYQQLDLFDTIETGSKNGTLNNITKFTPSPSGARSGCGPSLGTGIDTGSVSNLTAVSTGFDTVPVPKMGHNIKHKEFIKESKQPSQKFSKKNEPQNQNHPAAPVPKSVHVEPGCHPACPDSFGKRSEGSADLITEVRQFFILNNYPENEALKFFNHYQATGWKIKGITPITDWQAAAHKWMLNANKFEPAKSNKDVPLAKDIQYLYERFLEGQQVFKFIIPEHFTELNLELTKETMQQAWQERISQLSGTNQHSLNQIWDAYLQGNENNELVIKDKPNLFSLAKRIAVYNHFQHQKQSGKTSFPP